MDQLKPSAANSSRCLQLASSISHFGIGRDHMVSVLAPNVPAMYELHFAVPMAGAVLNTINTRLDARTISVLLRHSESRLLFVDFQPGPHPDGQSSASSLGAFLGRVARLCREPWVQVDGDERVCGDVRVEANVESAPGDREGEVEGETGSQDDRIDRRVDHVGLLQRPRGNRQLHEKWVVLHRRRGRHAPDGYLEIKDRYKDVIISCGENLSSVEVESVLYSHPSINEAAVVARPHEFWGETPCAFVTLKAETKRVPTEKEDARGRLPHYMVPKTVVFKAELPKTSTGKMQKFELREMSKALDLSSSTTHSRI
ncbi:hypothetical protein RJ639_035186 [Escallonia herrerae]|uniref:Uncharacterized protein n=1 Tax=Escallonia herrerae TaxID=1293975 RepID=A0AA88WUD7_9ASTE|nr:hypothetical protein RJ639_035186 [Escallonia herrerae]